MSATRLTAHSPVNPMNQAVLVIDTGITNGAAAGAASDVFVAGRSTVSLPISPPSMGGRTTTSYQQETGKECQ